LRVYSPERSTGRVEKGDVDVHVHVIDVPPFAAPKADCRFHTLRHTAGSTR
jgi:hypothetical protein